MSKQGQSPASRHRTIGRAATLATLLGVALAGAVQARTSAALAELAADDAADVYMHQSLDATWLTLDFVFGSWNILSTEGADATPARSVITQHARYATASQATQYGPPVAQTATWRWPDERTAVVTQIRYAAPPENNTRPASPPPSDGSITPQGVDKPPSSGTGRTSSVSGSTKHSYDYRQGR